jgi:hypothetical protein
MPDKTSVRVCVVALVSGEHDGIEPVDLKALAIAAGSKYDVVNKGVIYGTSPDDWAPYEDGVKIGTYFAGAGFDVISLSAHLATFGAPGKLAALVNEVDLYVFDPLFLALYGTRSKLIDSLDAAVGGNPKKGACVVLPTRMPAPLRDRLQDLSVKRLTLTQGAYEDGRGEFDADTPKRLNSYLKRFLKQFQDVPMAGNVQAMQQALVALFGVQPLQMTNPRIGQQPA